MRRLVSIGLAAALLTLSTLALPSTSRAQTLASYGDGVALVAGTAALSSIVLSFAIADLVSYANDHEGAAARRRGATLHGGRGDRAFTLGA